MPVFAADRGCTTSHQFAVQANAYGGGQHAAQRLRTENLLTSGTGLPKESVAGDINGLRLGTPEITRPGIQPCDMPELAGFLARALDDATDLSSLGMEVTQWRSQFSGLPFLAN